MASRKRRRRLHGFVAMSRANSETPRLRGLLAQIAREQSDYEVDLIFAHERLPTHALLIRNLHRLVARSDFVLCFTAGQNADVCFEAGLAFGLEKPLVLVILPRTRSIPATFVGHFFVELTGDSTDHEELKSALASVVAGLAGKGRTGATRVRRSVRLPRFGCAAGMERGGSGYEAG